MNMKAQNTQAVSSRKKPAPAKAKAPRPRKGAVKYTSMGALADAAAKEAIKSRRFAVLVKFGWISSGNCPKHRPWAERKARREARRQRAICRA